LRRSDPIDTSLQHLVFFPEKPQIRNRTIIAIHGRGADAPDLIPLVQSLELADTLVIAPRAPMPYDFGGGYTWYDLSEEAIPHPGTFNRSLNLLTKFISEVKQAYPIDPTRLILLGFSQGTVMSYSAGLTKPDGIIGIVALSGYIPQKSGLQFRWEEAKKLPVFVSHGAYDELIPVTLARESVQLLTKAEAKVEYHEYSMGHEIKQETLADLKTWIHALE